MNIFDALKSYNPKYELTNRRNFNEQELKAVKSAKVVPSTYGLSCCFLMVNGCKKYIPLSRDTVSHEGQVVDLKRAELLTLERDGSKIYRVEF